MADAKKALNRLYVPVIIIVLIFVACMGLAAYGIMNDSLIWIAGLVIGFFVLIMGIPLAWLGTSEKRKNLRIGALVSGRERTTFEIIAGSAGITEEEALQRIKWCLDHGYLDGYVINGSEVCQIRFIDPAERVHAAECPNCGASFTYKGEKGQCPYCGYFIENKD